MSEERWPYWTEPSWLEVDGVKTAYRRKGDGEVLVYLHGAGLTQAWLPLYERLSSSFDVVVPEHPGFGDSEMPSWLNSIDDLVLHYDAFLRELGVDNVHLVGHSLGGWIAAYLAIFYPERFKSLSLITPLGLRVPDAGISDPFRWSPERAREKLLGDKADDYAEYFDRGERVEATVHAYVELITFARLFWNPRYDIRLDHRLRRITTPTQVIAAEQDRFIPNQHPGRWSELIQGSTLKELPGEPDEPTGHLLIIQQPERLAELIAAHATPARS